MGDAENQPRSHDARQAREVDLGDLVHHVSNDLKILAQDEMELARLELVAGMQRPMADAGAIVLGGVLLLIGLGMLCTTLVVALEPLVPALWLRMSMMSAVYFALGAGVTYTSMRRLRRDAVPELRRTKREVVRTAERLQGEAKHD